MKFLLTKKTLMQRARLAGRQVQIEDFRCCLLLLVMQIYDPTVTVALSTSGNAIAARPNGQNSSFRVLDIFICKGLLELHESNCSLMEKHLFYEKLTSPTAIIILSCSKFDRRSLAKRVALLISRSTFWS